MELLRELVGTVSEGIVTSINEVPYVGPHLSELKTFGNVHYAVKKAYRSNHVFISGTTSVDDVKSFCRHHGIRFYEVSSQDEQADRSRLLRDSRVRNIQGFATSFEGWCLQGYGMVRNAGIVYLDFRLSDGAFLLHIYDARLYDSNE